MAYAAGILPAPAPMAFRTRLVTSAGAASLAALLPVIVAGCADHRIEHVAPDESRPHITWEITRDRGSELVCGSADPGRRCDLIANTPQQPSSVTVHLFLHAAAAQTSYLGVMRTPFVENASALANREVSMTVPRGSRPVGVTLSARVTSTPGTYTFTIALDATQGSDSASTRIAHDIPVTVTAPATAVQSLIEPRHRFDMVRTLAHP